MTQNITHTPPPPPSSSRLTLSIPRHSPPPLIYSDFSEDSESDIMEGPHPCGDASIVLQKVLGHLDQVVEHLQERNENDAANSIAQDTISIVNTFNNATAPWDMDSFCMNPGTFHRPNPKLPKAGASTVAQAAGGGTWASIAASPVDGKNGLIKFRPSDALVRRYVEEEAPTEARGTARVVWIQGWNPERHLSQVTDRVHQGPLLSMVYSEQYNAVCLIFRYAESASELLGDDNYHREAKGSPIFGRGTVLVPGLPYPEDDDLRRMSPPTNERRRLTFSRSQLFGHGMTEEQFKRDICQLVGEGNVELVWLFNAGNATVVFTSTSIARLVRDDFRKKARLNGPYQNVNVSFSHDPCEKTMNLITQIPSSSSKPRSRSGSNRSHGNGNGHGNGIGNVVVGVGRRESKRKNKVDDDGWQTVQGRKR